MPDLLLELRSEEIPARMQRKAAGDLKKLVTDALVEAGLTYEAAREYWTPRRLTLDIRGLNARSKDVREEIKGPSVSAPEQAVQGFLRKAGLSDIAQAHVHTDPKKGDFYVAHISKPGRAAEEIIASAMPGIIRNFPWPKSMRWGSASAEAGALRWVRPLQSIVCTFGPETEEPVVVEFEIDGIRSGNVTYGHRFHAPGAITVRRFDDYVSKLEAARVVLDGERRKQIIATDARNLAFASGLELVEDEGLLEEVSGLVEWPVVLMGEFEESFLDIPAEIIRLTIRANQKCFVCRPLSPLAGEMSAKPTEGVPSEGTSGLPSPAAATPPGASRHPPREGEGQLANRFILTAAIEASDGGAEIARGNGKVVRARLSDAVHFWKTDQADLPDLAGLTASAEKFGLDLGKPLDQRMARLDRLGVTFHAKLGTQGDRVERIAKLAEEIAPIVGADPALARRAAVLAKADLQTEVVGEFPELQGAMGRKYAELQGEDPAVAAAIEDHYRPQGPTDSVPTDPVAIAVALADKLDTLVGFWAIDEKPTGSKDPYALRRAALGVIRILVENGVRLELREAISAQQHIRLATETQVMRTRIIAQAFESHEEALAIVSELEAATKSAGDSIGLSSLLELQGEIFERSQRMDQFAAEKIADAYVGRFSGVEVQSFWILATDLLSFFHDRLKVYLRDKGARHDLIDAVLSGGGAAPSSGPSGHLLPGGEKSRTETAATPSPQRGEGGSRSETGEGAATNDDLLLVTSRVAALGIFLDTEDGRNLLAGAKRAANILSAEEKKGTRIAHAVDPALFSEPSEQALLSAVNHAESEMAQAIALQDFSAAMRALAALRQPVDAFFEAVLVNAEDEAVRANRLALLRRIRAATGQVADFSKIAG